MKDYILKEIHKDGYDGFILCLSSDSIFNYLNSLEKDLQMLKSSGTVLIDQLLITGNNDNRFVSIHYENGKLDLKSSEIKKPSDYFRMETVNLLNENFKFVENSILTEEQRLKIREKKLF